MKPKDLATQRLRNQRLIGEPLDNAVDVVRWLGAVQAQDYSGAKWALAQRMRNTSNAALDAAFNRGDILRTHVLRPTWHFVAPDEIRWLLKLTAPRVHRAMSSYDRHLELTEAVYTKCMRILSRALRDGAFLTRAELSEALAKGGFEARGQRLAHIAMHAELEAIICSGPLRGKQFTYALLDDRVPPAVVPSRDESLAMLTRRYFESHGPATLQDYGWWSGLSMADVRRGVAMMGSDLQSETMNDVTYLFAGDMRTSMMRKAIVHLLPNYDEHIVAYRDHRASFDHALLDGGQIRVGSVSAHLVTLNGFIVGGWRRTLTGDRVILDADMMLKLNRAQSAAFERCVNEYGRFMGLPVSIGNQ
ncbi:MAG TPA: winged helix DNA-binding domain-containing protein [Gemmatimonadaceae bacterium]|nr:winged helix DNA-binding domain-containing protein [Gemmatimonadaceae bacterium]